MGNLDSLHKSTSEWIKLGLKKGHSIKTLRYHLIKHGHEEDQIDKIIEELGELRHEIEAEDNTPSVDKLPEPPTFGSDPKIPLPEPKKNIPSPPSFENKSEDKVKKPDIEQKEDPLNHDVKARLDDFLSTFEENKRITEKNFSLINEDLNKKDQLIRKSEQSLKLLEEEIKKLKQAGTVKNLIRN